MPLRLQACLPVNPYSPKTKKGFPFPLYNICLRFSFLKHTSFTSSVKPVSVAIWRYIISFRSFFVEFNIAHTFVSPAMKFAPSAVLLAAAAASIADARPHAATTKHARGLHLRGSPAGYSFLEIQTGQTVSFDDACQGIDSGLYHFSPNLASLVQRICDSAESGVPSPSPSSTAVNVPTTSASTRTSTSETPVPTTSPTPPRPSSTGSSNSSDAGLDRIFPDGQLDCSEFPSGYGAISLDYLGLGGWSGIQYVQISGNSVSRIATAVANKGVCKDGAMCSYACPPGYLKSQWPSTQGSKGQSVGGLKCQNGKLYLTNPTLSESLCIKGAGEIEAVNELDQDVAVCRTDYPGELEETEELSILLDDKDCEIAHGAELLNSQSNYTVGTESETVPAVAAAGKEITLACPNEKSYFKWLNKPTSAQYYVNNKGVPSEKACRWGNQDSPSGNFAPLNLGVGKDIFSVYWLSIIPNKPTTQTKLDFNVRIEGPDVSMECKYENGKFYSNGAETPAGCTASTSLIPYMPVVLVPVLVLVPCSMLYGRGANGLFFFFFFSCRRLRRRAKLTLSSIEEEKEKERVGDANNHPSPDS